MDNAVISQAERDEEILTFNIPDEALERAASAEQQAFTMMYCTGSWDNCVRVSAGAGIFDRPRRREAAAHRHLFLRFLRLPLLLRSRIANKDNFLQLAHDFSSLS
jgi:hypothetical protein